MRSYQLTKQGRTWVSLFGVLTLVAASVAASVNTKNTPAPIDTDSPAYRQAMSLSDAFRQTASAVQPSVVTITSESKVAGPAVRGQSPEMNEDMLRRFFEGSPFGERFKGGPQMDRRFFKPSSAPQQVRRGIGTGVVISSDGLILTNNHVVADADDVRVKLSDGREYLAVDVRTDPKTDLAVLKIKASGLTPARLGNSDRVEIGDWVLALGQPFGLEGTVTAGIISAKQRGIGITARENFLQTDAAINPGNSGGPLVNLAGEVIGINTAISSAGGGNDGVGFAIPINVAKWVSDQLVETGSVRRAFLGVGIQQVTHELAGQFGVQANQGVLVTHVTNDSPAAAAGVQPGDVILSYAGDEVASPRELQNVVERSEPGAKHDLVLLRNGKQMTLSVAAGEQPAETTASTPQSRQAAPASKLGFEVGELSEAVAQRLGLGDVDGVVVTKVDPIGAAAKVGLSSGMVIAQVNRQPVSSIDDFRAATKDLESKDGLLLLIRTPNGSRFVVVPGS